MIQSLQFIQVFFRNLNQIIIGLKDKVFESILFFWLLYWSDIVYVA